MDNLQNHMMLMPIGMLTGLIMKRRRWWKSCLIGFTLSACVEMFQFVFKRSFCELDDVIHNTTGTLIGYCIAILLIKSK
ncbi:VanZ family protein [Bacteroides pyogenes]|uniref:VanZ family protein n=1 Tax=Bacteroides pyogenes TaxID=310300 RepID=UPI003709696B